MPLFKHPAPHPPGTPPTQHEIAAAHLKGIAEDEDRLPGRPMQWLVMMIFSAIVGAMAGAVGALFRYTLTNLDARRTEMIVWAHHHGGAGFGWAAPVGLCAAGAGAAVYLTQWLAPQSAGSGIPRVEAVLRNHLRPAGAP